jgi:hypothetical protein
MAIRAPRPETPHGLVLIGTRYAAQNRGDDDGGLPVRLNYFENRSGDAALIAGYVGENETFDRATETGPR